MNNSSCWYQGGGGMFDWWVSWQPHIQLEGVSGIDYPDSTPPLYQPIQWQWRFFHNFFFQTNKEGQWSVPWLRAERVTRWRRERSEPARSETLLSLVCQTLPPQHHRNASKEYWGTPGSNHNDIISLTTYFYICFE